MVACSQGWKTGPESQQLIAMSAEEGTMMVRKNGAMDSNQIPKPKWRGIRGLGCSPNRGNA